MIFWVFGFLEREKLGFTIFFRPMDVPIIISSGLHGLSSGGLGRGDGSQGVRGDEGLWLGLRATSLRNMLPERQIKFSKLTNTSSGCKLQGTNMTCNNIVTEKKIHYMSDLGHIQITSKIFKSCLDLEKIIISTKTRFLNTSTAPALDRSWTVLGPFLGRLCLPLT